MASDLPHSANGSHLQSEDKSWLQNVWGPVESLRPSIWSDYYNIFKDVKAWAMFFLFFATGTHPVSSLVQDWVGCLHPCLKAEKLNPCKLVKPWKKELAPHTCSDLSYRIVMWNAPYVQKHSSKSWSERKKFEILELTLPFAQIIAK